MGRRFFDMNEPNLEAIAQDGRLGLALSPHRYSIIALDAYRPPYIPWHLSTREFFQTVYDHLEDDGVMAINVGRSPQDRRLVDGLVGTISSVFPSVYVMDIPDTFNTMIYATAQPTTLDNLYQNYVSIQARQDVHPLLKATLERLIVNMRETPASDTVFTDDWAPIEWITNQMVLNFLTVSELEETK